MDRLRSTRRHAQGYYCEASRHHRHEPRATGRKSEACGNGLCADWLHAQECAEFFQSEMAKWGPVIKEAGLKATKISRPSACSGRARNTITTNALAIPRKCAPRRAR